MENNKNGLTYKDIQPEINTICAKNPGCWHTPAAEIKCPYADVCFAEYEGSDNGKSALEEALLARYKELNGIG